MDWQAYWDKVAEESDPFRQVARIGGKGQMGPEIMQETAARIARLLDLQSRDHVLDVCCGNGLLTRLVLPYCDQMTAVDISEGQIGLAKELGLDKVSFQVADAAALQEKLSGFYDHIYLYFSFQYLESSQQAKASLQEMADLLKPGGKILLGDVPEKEKLEVFYPGFLDRIKYKIKLVGGKSLMGRFWSLQELKTMALPLGLNVQRLAQPPHFPYAHYRADFLLEKI